MILAFHKPYGVLSQFTPDGSANRPLAGFSFPKNVYSLGRLDADSEGLLLLSDEPGINHQLLAPEAAHPREYWVQVEGLPTDETLEFLSRGVVVQGRKTLPCLAARIEVEIPERQPPIRVRQAIPTGWISLTLTEGRNRQVRRMTAAVGHPTLRLIRAAIGDLKLGSLPVGEWRELDAQDRKLIWQTRRRLF